MEEWICLYLNVDGAKMRKFQKEIGCSMCEAEGILTTIWRWGARGNADIYGNLPAVDRADIAELLRPRTSLEPDKVVDALIEHHWIDEGENGLSIHDWLEWQTYHHNYVKARANNRKRQARYKEKHKDDNVTGNVTTNVRSNVTEKKKQKTETVYEVFDRLTDTEIPLPEDVSAQMKVWLKYKSEKKQGYKETGLKSLLKEVKKQVDAHGEKYVIDKVNKSINNNWAGIFFDDDKKKNGNDYLASVIQGAS